MSPYCKVHKVHVVIGRGRIQCINIIGIHVYVCAHHQAMQKYTVTYLSGFGSAMSSLSLPPSGGVAWILSKCIYE